MKSLIIVSIFLISLLTLSAAEADELVCMPLKASDAPAFVNSDANSVTVCDFETGDYFSGTNFNPQLAKSLCNAMWDDTVFRLKINDHSLELNGGGTSWTKFLRHNHADGIAGVALSDGQFQDMLIFAPETKRLSYVNMT